LVIYLNLNYLNKFAPNSMQVVRHSHEVRVALSL
jgi:hypothetical protein